MLPKRKIKKVVKFKLGNENSSFEERDYRLQEIKSFLKSNKIKFTVPRWHGDGGGSRYYIIDRKDIPLIKLAFNNIEIKDI